MESMTRQVEHVSEELSALGQEVQAGFHTMADDQQRVLDVLSALGDGSVDLRNELADLKARLEALEKRAS